MPSYGRSLIVVLEEFVLFKISLLRLKLGDEMRTTQWCRHRQEKEVLLQSNIQRWRLPEAVIIINAVSDEDFKTFFAVAVGNLPNIVMTAHDQGSHVVHSSTFLHTAVVVFAGRAFLIPRLVRLQIVRLFIVLREEKAGQGCPSYRTTHHN